MHSDDVAEPQTVTDFDMELESQAEEGTYFSPEKGNVCFGSAYDGWAFRLLYNYAFSLLQNRRFCRIVRQEIGHQERDAVENSLG